MEQAKYWLILENLALPERTAQFRSSFHSQGKFIRINFDVTGYIVGANIETCILCSELHQAGRSRMNKTHCMSQKASTAGSAMNKEGGKWPCLC